MIKFIVVFLILANHSTVSAQEKVTVIGNQEIPPGTMFMQGFLHGGARFLDSAKVAKLRPEFWRIGAYFLAGSGYQETRRFTPKITVNINDLYMIVNNITSQTLSQPWVNGWAAWDNLVAMIANNSVKYNEPVDYWDVWGEPDNFWTGTYSQWIEMYRRTDSILTSIIANAKIIGPAFGFATCNFNAVPILQFLDRLYSVGSNVSGVSWHEFCNPQALPLHVQQIRDSLGLRPWLGNLEILITEYAGPAHHTIPGWNVGWLYYLEKSKVDWASRACWTESDGKNIWSNCHVGLNGLFMWDNKTPQSSYWVHRAYAELDSIRLVCRSSHAHTVGLASKNNSTREMKILAGRFDNPNLGSQNAPANVEVIIENYSYCVNCTKPIVIQRIPGNTVAYSIPLNSPVTTHTGTLTFNGRSASVQIQNFVDGDAYIIYINPGTNSVLTTDEPQLVSDTFRIYPNPAKNILTIELSHYENTTVQIFNLLGVLVKEVQIQQSGQIDISSLNSGLYFVRDTKYPAQAQKFMKQ